MLKPENRIFSDRERTNIFRPLEQKLILFFLKKIPQSVSPNALTGIGLLGSIMVLGAFVAAHYVHVRYLFLGIIGLFINWFGDSLDGRVAYYRGIPRKWFGFSLDIVMDWIGTVCIGLGYIVYAPNVYELAGFIFVALYGWAMIISQLRYKITNAYSIDFGLVGPTEVRVIIMLMLLIEIWFIGAINIFALAICLILLVINISDTRKLLKLGDARDLLEKNPTH